MKISNYLQNLAFVVVFVVDLLHYTYAPWTTEPDVPPDSRKDNCIGWLQYHSFTDNPVTNRNKSVTRARKYDQDVHIQAALYASYLTVFDQYNPIDPISFCEDHKMNNMNGSYITLKDIKKTCIEWIKLYGFSATDLHSNIWDMVSRRSRQEDKIMALWPALYAQYISSNESRASTTQEEFCFQMGHANEQLLPYMSILTTFKTCQEWIEFAGYNDDLEHNMKKTLSRDDNYDFVMNQYIRYYSQELRNLIFLDFHKNYRYTSFLMNNPNEKGYMTPKEFCRQFGEVATEKRRYRLL